MANQSSTASRREGWVAALVLSGIALFIGGLIWVVYANASIETAKARAEQSAIASSGSCWKDLFNGDDDPCSGSEPDYGTLRAQQVLSPITVLAGLGMFVGGIVLHRRKDRPVPVVAPHMPSATPEDPRQPCTQCGESVPVIARVCRFCGVLLASEERPSTA